LWVYIQIVPGGKVNILGDCSIGRAKFEKRIRICVIFGTVSLSLSDRLFFFFFFFTGNVGGGVQLGPLGTAATNDLLCQPRVILMMENLVE
jgi:hypothetical protein